MVTAQIPPWLAPYVPGHSVTDPVTLGNSLCQIQALRVMTRPPVWLTGTDAGLMAELRIFAREIKAAEYHVRDRLQAATLTRTDQRR